MKGCGLSRVPSRRTFDRRLVTISKDIKNRITTMGKLFVRDKIVDPHILSTDSTLTYTDKTEKNNINPEIVILPPYGLFTAFLTVTSRLGDQSEINSANDEIKVTAVGSTLYAKNQNYIQITPINKEIYQLSDLKDYPFSEWLNDKLKELGILWKDNSEFMLLIIGIFLTPNVHG